MKQVYIIKESSPSLVLMFGGWGSGPELFREYAVPGGYDFMLCYDYRDMEFDFSLLEGYSRVRLVAWSMGVWAAGVVFCNAAGHALPAWESRIAIGGTPFPVDDTRGIPAGIFNGTLEQLSAQSLVKFRRRMCGPGLEHFMAHVPDRDTDELREELGSIGKCVGEMACDCNLGWDLAIVGGADMIFPPANQKSAWESLGVKVKSVDEARHYSPEVFRLAIGGALDQAGKKDCICWTRN